MSAYKEPLYYEIAFSFVDPQKQVDLFEEFIKKLSKIDVRSFLDIGCGPSLQLREVARRGYEAIGLDISPQMLSYLKQKAKEEGLKIETIKADMIDFKLKKKADFAFIMMGTISCLKSNKDFLSHLDSVSNALNKGGLYLIENFRLDWANKNLFKPITWTMKKDNIRVKTTYSIQLRDTINQLVKETMRLEIEDGGKGAVLEESAETKMIFPQEFLELIKLNNKFEFLGWFERDKLKPLRKASMDNITLLRRK